MRQCIAALFNAGPTSSGELSVKQGSGWAEYNLMSLFQLINSRKLGCPIKEKELALVSEKELGSSFGSANNQRFDLE